MFEFKEIESMFVYQESSNGIAQEASARRQVERFFHISERWASGVTDNSILVVLCALLFGGVSKVLVGIPLAALVGTIGVLAWFLGEQATGDEPKWVHQLSLASTGLLYLALGHCLGLVVLALVPIAMLVVKSD